jgi:CheY-like chemotaxis protein
MVLDAIEEEHPIRSDIIQIMQSGQRASAIVQDLLTLARRGVQTRKVINLNDTIRDCQKTPEFENILSFNPLVGMHLDLEMDLLNIIGSPVHLGKTILNLISNAVEAMPAGGSLVITTNNQYLDLPIQGYDNVREGDYVVLSVADTGEGISEKDVKRIFEPFYTKKIMGKSGTGLGLAVVWGTVKDHNGYINVVSELGKGTVFTLYFPVTRDEVAKESTSLSISDYLGRGESILVVDDIRGQRDLATRMLTRLNYQVASVSSGEQAVEYIKTNNVDLVVLDMIMDPGMDGLDTFTQVIKIQPGQKVLIVSGFSETERVKKAQELGAGAYLKKPYVLERLGLAVRKELDRG